MARPLRSARPGAPAGFTLVELLVALGTLALIASLGWRGISGMSMAQADTQRRLDQMQSLQLGLAQWGVDLDALAQLPHTNALEWDGLALRLVRRAAPAGSEGLYVVAWTGRSGRWLRWQSPPLQTRGDVERAWRQAGEWAQGQSTALRRFEVAIAPLTDWQLFYFRGDSWSHPLSSDVLTPGSAPAGADAEAASTAQSTAVVPDGVRLVLQLPPGQPLAGRVVRDWVSPKLGGAAS